MSVYIGYPAIPFQALTRSSNSLTFDDDFKRGNYIYGERYLRGKLSSASTGIKRLTYDLGASSTNTANYLAIMRADRLKGQNVKRIILRGGSSSFFNPGQISGLKLWLDATRGITADSTNLVSAWADNSGNGYNVSQATGSKQPYITGTDNRENMLTYSEQFDVSPWTPGNGASFTANSAVSPIDGLTTADTWVEDTSTGNHRVTSETVPFYNGITYRASLYVKQNGRTRFEFYLGGAAFAAAPNAVFDVNTGTVVSSGSGGTGAISDVGSGWYRCTLTATAGATGTGRLDNYMRNGSNSNNYTGDGASGFYIVGAQICNAAADTTYLKTTSAPIYRGVNNNRAVRFDATSDRLTSAVGLSSIISASAYTAFFVIRTGLISTGNIFFADNNGVATYDAASSSKIRMTNYDGSVDAISSTTTVSSGSTYIICGRHESGTIYLDINGSNESSTASGDTTSMGSSFDIGCNNGSSFFGGDLCEAIFYNTALGSSDRANINNYLAAKWQTTPVYVTSTFDTETYYGPDSNDYITTFTESTAYRHWCLDFDLADPSTTTTNLDHSKHYFGPYFDMGKAPVDWDVFKGPARQADSYGDSGSEERRRIDDTKYRGFLLWDGITNAKKTSFFNTIVRYKDNHRFVLFTTEQHQILDNQRIIHCKITDVKTDNSSKYDGYNTIEVNFEQVLG